MIFDICLDLDTASYCSNLDTTLTNDNNDALGISNDCLAADVTDDVLRSKQFVAAPLDLVILFAELRAHLELQTLIQDVTNDVAKVGEYSSLWTVSNTIYSFYDSTAILKCFPVHCRQFHKVTNSQMWLCSS